MTTQKINHTTPSFFLLLDFNHVLLRVLLLLYASQLSFSQPGTGTNTSSMFSPPISEDTDSTLGQKFNPLMAIIMVVLVSAFFVMGFFSVYVRQCADRRFRAAHFDPAVWAGAGRRSWSRYHGLEQEIIETFPTFLYSAVKGLKFGKQSLECAVCLVEFEDDQKLRLLPKCSHVFHPDCIDAWLASHVTCPVCRANLVPKPGDLPFAQLQVFDSDDNLAETDHSRPKVVYHETQNQVQIHVADEIMTERPQLITTQSPKVNLLTPANQNRPPRSWSTGWRLNALFSRSNSTGNSLIRPGENCERFTLRLPEEVRNQIMNSGLNRTKSCVAFSRASSPIMGYRSSSGGTERGRHGGRHGHDRWNFTMTPPFIFRTGSVQSIPNSKGESTSGGGSATPPKNFLIRSVKSYKSPFDRLFRGIDNNDRNSNNEVGERSSVWLRSPGQV